MGIGSAPAREHGHLHAGERGRGNAARLGDGAQDQVPPPRHQYGYRDPGLAEIYLPFGELVSVIMTRSRYFWQLAAGVGLRYLAYMMPSFGFRGEQGRYVNDANIEPSAAAGLPTSTVDLEAFAQIFAQCRVRCVA